MFKNNEVDLWARLPVPELYTSEYIWMSNRSVSKHPVFTDYLMKMDDNIDKPTN